MRDCLFHSFIHTFFVRIRIASFQGRLLRGAANPQYDQVKPSKLRVECVRVTGQNGSRQNGTDKMVYRQNGIRKKW